MAGPRSMRAPPKLSKSVEERRRRGLLFEKKGKFLTPWYSLLNGSSSVPFPKPLIAFM